MEQEAALVEVFWGLIYLRVKTQNIKQEQCSNKLNKDFLNGPHEKKKIFKKISVKITQIFYLDFSP